MVKTKDYVVTNLRTVNEFSAKNKTAIYVRGIKQSDIDTSSFQIKNGNLLFATLDNIKFFISDYEKIKYIKTDIYDRTELLDIISNNYIDNNNNIITKYNKNKRLIVGTDYNDTINAKLSEYIVPTSGKNKNKGLTIKGNNGNDTIIGTVGDDNLYGVLGNNVFIFSNNDGHDTVYSGKLGYEDTIKFNNIAQQTLQFNRGTGKNKNDLIIGYNMNAEGIAKSSVTVKNYYKLDKNGNATTTIKWIETINGKVSVEDAINNQLYTNYISGTSANLYIDGSDGNDKISGSANDSFVYGGNGNDEITIYGNNNTIYGGKGNDYLYVVEDESKNQILVFNNGDGKDVVNAYGSTLKFTGTSINDLKFEHLGSDLIIKYNNGKDSVRLRNSSDDEESINTNYPTNYIIEDKNGKIVKLADILPKTISSIGTDYLKGTSANDIIILPYSLSNYELKTGQGDDYISGYAKNLNIYSETGNDKINIWGNGNIINTGKGNDYIYIREYEDETKSKNVIVLKKGDGNDVLKSWNNSATLKMEDSSFEDLNFEKFGKDLIIKYNSNKDSIQLSNYYEEDNYSEYVIQDKTGVKKDLTDIIPQSGKVPNSNKTLITGTKGTDTISVHGVDNLTIDGGKGNDNIYGDYNNSTVYGGDGHDEISTEGLNNKIYGGKGNDFLRSQIYSTPNTDVQKELINTFIFNNGDGHDIMDIEQDTIEQNNNVYNILKFNDTNLSDIKLEKITITDTYEDYDENDNVKYVEETNYFLRLLYNNGKDNVVFTHCIYEDNTEFRYLLSNTTIEDKNGNKRTLKYMYENNLITNTNVYKNDDIFHYYDDDENETEISEKINKTINGTNGENYFEAYEVYNCTINGLGGNDEIYIGGNNNIISGGKGNDNIYLLPDCIYNEQTDEEISQINKSTLVFKKGDGNDNVGGEGVETTLYFKDVNLENLKLEKFGRDLIIKYSNNDSVSISNYYEQYESFYEEEQYIWDCKSYILKDMSEFSVTLDEFVKSYNGLAISTTNIINGTNGNDYIITPTGVKNITITSGNGDDYIKFSESDNITVYGGSGNDEIDGWGANSTIYGGKGNDYIHLYEDGKNNTIVFNNGDGQDTVYSSVDNTILKFEKTKLSDIGFEKYGEDLVLKYNNGKDSVRLRYYFEEYPESNYYKILDSTGKIRNVNDEIKSFINLPEITDSKIIGTNTNDIIRTPYFNTDDIYNLSIDENTVITDNDGYDILTVSTNAGNSNIVFNVSQIYVYDKDHIDFGDIHILNNTNFIKWHTNNMFEGITVKNNTVEKINFSDKEISSSNIAQIAQNVSAWLTADGRDYADVNTVLSNGNTTEIEELITYFSNNVS